jgi:hypothetical protein
MGAKAISRSECPAKLPSTGLFSRKSPPRHGQIGHSNRETALNDIGVVLAFETTAVGPQHHRNERDQCPADDYGDFEHSGFILNLFVLSVLEELGVDEEPEPERLQGPEDEPFPAV